MFEPHDDAKPPFTLVQWRMTPMTPDRASTDIVVNEPNLWRLDTPGHAGWPRSARPDDPRKYFMVSADCHANEPADLWVDAHRREVPRRAAAGRSPTRTA